MTTRHRRPARRNKGGINTTRQRARRGMCLTVLATMAVSIAVAPSAVADSVDSLRAAIAAARETACGPLQSDPVIDQAAERINETTDKWIDHTARAVPETDALPILKDLGYGGSTAVILSGAAKSDADAIRAILLQGYSKIPDCSYTDFGVSALHNATKDMILTTVVLAA